MAILDKWKAIVFGKREEREIMIHVWTTFFIVVSVLCLSTTTVEEEIWHKWWYLGSSSSPSSFFSRPLATRDPLTTGKIEARAPSCTRPISFFSPSNRGEKKYYSSVLARSWSSPARENLLPRWIIDYPRGLYRLIIETWISMNI